MVWLQSADCLALTIYVVVDRLMLQFAFPYEAMLTLLWSKTLARWSHLQGGVFRMDHVGLLQTGFSQHWM